MEENWPWKFIFSQKNQVVSCLAHFTWINGSWHQSNFVIDNSIVQEALLSDLLIRPWVWCPEDCLFSECLKNNFILTIWKIIVKQKRRTTGSFFFPEKENISKDPCKHEFKLAGSSYANNHVIIKTLREFIYHVVGFT